MREPLRLVAAAFVLTQAVPGCSAYSATDDGVGDGTWSSSNSGDELQTPATPKGNPAQDAGSAAPVADAAVAPTTAACSVHGSAGAQLYGPADLTQDECESECAQRSDTNPLRSCTWGSLDIGPIAPCSVIDLLSGGAELFSADGISMSACAATCAEQHATHEAASCSWSGSDINPVDDCTVLGVDGPSYGPSALTEWGCRIQCLGMAADDASCTCSWGALDVRN
jgi:hypothetical protein